MPNLSSVLRSKCNFDFDMCAVVKVLCERPKDVRVLCAKAECMRLFDDLEGARLVIEFAANLDSESLEVAEEAVKIKLQMDEEALRYTFGCRVI